MTPINFTDVDDEAAVEVDSAEARPLSPWEIILEREVPATVANAPGPAAKLQAIKDGAQRLALACDRGDIDRERVELSLFDLANNHGLQEQLTNSTVEIAICNGLNLKLLHNANGHGSEPPLASPDDYGADTSQSSPSAGPPDEPRRFELVMLDDIAVEDDPVELIEDFLPMGPTFGLSFGAPKSLKSFWWMHVGLHITGDLLLRGRRVQQGAVIYVTSEGLTGVKRRLVAMRRSLGLEGKRVPFFLVKTMPNLGAGPEDRKALEAAIRPVLASLDVPLRMIVIDTVRRATPGKSENKPEDMSVFVANCDPLATAFNALVIGVHHSPRSDDTRSSGSNVLDAAADIGLSIVRDGKSKRAACEIAWNKDGDEGGVWSFELRAADVGVDREGKTITSCYVEIIEEPTTEPRRPATAPDMKLSAAERHVYEILQEAVTDAGEHVTAPGIPPAVKSVSRDALVAYCKARDWWRPGDEKQQRKEANRLSARLSVLCGKHAIGTAAGRVWLSRTP